MFAANGKKSKLQHIYKVLIVFTGVVTKEKLTGDNLGLGP